MSAIKQPLTPERAMKVKFSLQKMAILCQMLLIENQYELDVDYRIPIINNFAKRIVNDSKSIASHLVNSGRLSVKTVDSDFSEDYAGEIWRVVTLLAGLDIEVIKEFADSLENELQTILAEAV